MGKLTLMLATTVVIVLSSMQNVHSLLQLNPKQIVTPFMPNILQPIPKTNKDSPTPSSVVLNSLEQRVDQYNPQNLDTFNQRYYMNGEYFQPGGPVFIFLGGEWSIEPSYIEEGLMFDMAREFRGYMFYLEHRFYGESFPTEDLSVDNLRYLNADQAIADIAYFCEYITNFYVTPGAENSPIILIGAHYSANLAVWSRQKFPHLIEGVWAVSAPVEARIDFHEFKDVAGAVYLTVGGPECYNRIDEGFSQLEDLMDDDMDELVDIFNLCYPLDTQVERYILNQVVGEILSFAAVIGSVEDVEEMCEIISEGEDSIHGIANLIDLIIPDDIPFPCLPIDYDELIEIIKDESLQSDAATYGLRQFTYQTCTQLGWFHTSNSEFHPFGDLIPIYLFHMTCEDVFGPTFTNETLQANVDRTNVAFGGQNLHSVTNVVYTYGMHDAWRILGIQERLNADSDAIIIRGYGQGAELLSLDATDTIDMYWAKTRIRQLIQEWISEGVPS